MRSGNPHSELDHEAEAETGRRPTRFPRHLRATAPPTIAAFRTFCLMRLGQLSRDVNRPLAAREAETDAIRAALAELAGLELEPDAAVVASRLAELAAGIE